MKTTRIRRHSSILAILLTAAFLMLLCGTTQAATKKTKKYQTIKSYSADGKLQSVTEYKYDAKGNTTRSSFTYYKEDGTVDNHNETTYKITYKKGTNIRTKTEVKGTIVTGTIEYDKQGVPKKTTYKYNDGSIEKTTYSKKSGKYYKVSETRDGNGKLLAKYTYDKKGNMKGYTIYNDDGSTYGGKFTITYYKNGNFKTQSSVYTDTTGKETDSYKIYYDKNGHATKQVEKDDDGEHTYIYKNKVKNGYVLESACYKDGAFSSKTVYTYTKKQYPVQD